MDWVGQLIHTYYPMMQTMFQGHQSCGSCKEGLKGIHFLKIVCEHDQEIPQLQAADNPMALQGRDTQPSRDTRKTNYYIRGSSWLKHGIEMYRTPVKQKSAPCRACLHGLWKERTRGPKDRIHKKIRHQRQSIARQIWGH